MSLLPFKQQLTIVNCPIPLPPLKLFAFHQESRFDSRREWLREELREVFREMSQGASPI